MTLILRRTDAPLALRLGKAGVCRVSLCEVVGAWGTGRVTRVVILERLGRAAA